MGGKNHTGVLKGIPVTGLPQFDDDFFIDQNLVIIYFYINGQEYNVELNEYTYHDTDKILSVQIDIDSPGHFVPHDENIYQLTLFATVLKDEEVKKVYFIVYSRQLDQYHSVYYNTPRFNFEDYQMPE